MSRLLHAIAAVAIVSATGLPAGPAVAQTVGPSSAETPAAAKPAGKAAKTAKGGKAGEAGDAAAGKKDPAVAQRSLDGGIKSFEAGKLDQAIQSITYALSGGGLPSQQMARALYYRGLAFRKQGKPAQAISDLTSAIWLKGGLAEADRASALENRSAAYREAGLGEPPAAGDAVARSAPAAVATPAPSWQTATVSGGTTAPTQPVTTALAPAPGPGSPGQGSPGFGSQVGSFFGNIFGSGSSSAQAQPSVTPTTTASTSLTGAGQPVAATSSWSEATQVAGAKGGSKAVAVAAAAPSDGAAALKPSVGPSAAGTAAVAPGSGVTPVAVAAAPQAAANPAAAPAKAVHKGKFKLQVAAVRSRAEADQLAQKLKQAHGSAIGGREPVVEESVIGAMGTFYRVRVGPYADASEPRQLCTRIKPDGFDCLVVTQ